MRIEIKKTGINGEGIGYTSDKKPLFVPGVLVGEIADVEIVEKTKNFSVGKVKKVIQESEKRCRPRCKIQKSCQGCPLMIALYDEQLNMKMEVLKQSLIKYAQIDPRLIKPIIPSELKSGYRNQCKVPFGMHDNRLVTGMYQPNSNYFNEVEKCLIHDEKIEKVRIKLLQILNRYSMKSYDYHTKSGLRSCVIRQMSGNVMMTLVTGQDRLDQNCIDEIMQIDGVVSLWQSIHTQKKSVDIFGKTMIHLGGRRTLEFDFMGLTMQLSPRSFFQLNTMQAEKLYDVIASLIEKPKNLIVEAYSGIGGISMALRDKAERIIGVESIQEAVSNANAIAKANGIEHVSFICDDAAKRCEQYAKKGHVDLLVVDPPRSGLDDHMLETILKSKIKEVIYISCNPATLGKNLAVLRERYNVKMIQPLDMFPHTIHVETVAHLIRK